jgi:hypothetical protein|tara:strand:- start:881 stop:1150 length:270 start_codon:yes stop_codon:yes gene_type:complete
MKILKSIDKSVKYLNKAFNPIVFMISLCVGIFFVYVITPPPKVIVKYPTPENSGRIIYKDEAHNCFKINSTEVKCPKNKTNVKSIPVQE